MQLLLQRGASMDVRDVVGCVVSVTLHSTPTQPREQISCTSVQFSCIDTAPPPRHG